MTVRDSKRRSSERNRPIRCAWWALCGTTLLTLTLSNPVVGQTAPGRAVIDALEFEPLDFEQPVVDRHTVSGVDVLVLENHELPLVSVHAYFRGGYGLFGREFYAPCDGASRHASLRRHDRPGTRLGGRSTRIPFATDGIRKRRWERDLHGQHPHATSPHRDRGVGEHAGGPLDSTSTR